MPVVKAGGLLFQPQDPTPESLRVSLRLKNPEHTQWIRRMFQKWISRFPADVRPTLSVEDKEFRAFCYRQRGEPEFYVDPLIAMDSGPWAGGYAAPRYAPCESGEIVEKTYFPEADKLVFNGEVREHQKPAVGEMVHHGFGLLVGGCGVGKTAMGNAIVAHYPTRALILVHTRDLAGQWKEEIEKFLGVNAAIVGYGLKSDGTESQVVVASIQTLAQWTWWQIHSWGKEFGVVILDEAHHAPAQSFLRVFSALPARHRFALTATPERPDGLGPWLHWVFGPEMWRVPQEEMQRIGRVMTPEIEFLEAPEIDLDRYTMAHKRDEAIAFNPERNRRIIDRAEQLAKQGRKILILGKLVAHVELLADELTKRGLACVALTGQLAKGVRKEAIALMKAGKWDIVTATSLADEGLDAPILDTAFLVHPDGNVQKIEQRIGRVTRPLPGKPKPLVVDMMDSWGPFQGYLRRRRKLYKQRGWL